MTKLVSLIALAFFFCFGCTSCAHTGQKSWDTQGDPDAVEVQAIMRQTVEVRHEVTILVPRLEEGQPPKMVPVPAGMIGTGVVVADRSGQSVVLTAAHVCEPKDTWPIPVGNAVVNVPVLGEIYYVWTIDDERLEAEVAYLDKENDVCAMVVSGRAGEVARVTDDPPVGARVLHVGSPGGILNYHKAFVADGRYMGRHKFKDGSHFDECSTPADHGSSGGGVFYHGRLFGIASRVTEGFKHITLYSGDGPMRRAIAEGKRRMGR